MITVEKVPYGGWPNCYRLTNGTVELVVTTDVGPRVIRCGYKGGQNLFKEFSAQMGKSGEKDWQPRGGHRLWTGPESALSYALDNGPVSVKTTANGIILTQPIEPETGYEKQISVALEESGAVEVKHQVRNTNNSPRRFVSWGLTMMAPGGIAVTGFPPRGTHPEMLLPTNPVVMWGYTNFSDPRWKFTEKYLVLRQDPAATVPVKCGLWNPKTWEAYLLDSELFLKTTVAARAPEHYPDMGCSLETFTNNEFLEMETLSPLDTVPAGGIIGHAERWTLHRDIHVADWTDKELDRVIAPLV